MQVSVEIFAKFCALIFSKITCSDCSLTAWKYSGMFLHFFVLSCYFPKFIISLVHIGHSKVLIWVHLITRWKRKSTEMILVQKGSLGKACSTIQKQSPSIRWSVTSIISKSRAPHNLRKFAGPSYVAQNAFLNDDTMVFILQDRNTVKYS